MAQINVFLSQWVSLSQIGVSPSLIPLSIRPSLFPPLSTTFHSFDLGLEREAEIGVVVAVKQKSVVVVDGCEAVAGWVRWWVEGWVCCWSGFVDC